MKKSFPIKLLALMLFAAGVWAIGELIYPAKLPMVNIKLGREKFEKYCSKCHSLDQDSQGYGPNLYGIVEIAGRRRTGTNAVNYVWESVVAPDAFKVYEGMMPKGIADQLGRDGVFQIVCYLLDREGRKEYAAVWQLAESWKQDREDGSETAVLPLARLERGKSIFFGKGKCSECHKLNSINASDHLVAPDISGVGINDEKYLLDSINCPSCILTQGYRFANAKIDDLVVTGRLIEKGDSMRIINRDVIGYTVYQCDKEDVDLSLLKTSMMPDYNDGVLNAEEKADLVLFLKTLR